MKGDTRRIRALMRRIDDSYAAAAWDAVLDLEQELDPEEERYR